MRVRTNPLYNYMAAPENNNSAPGKSSQEGYAPSPLTHFLDILGRKYTVQLDRLEKRLLHIVLPWSAL